MRSDALRLRDMLFALEQIRSRWPEHWDEFEKDEMAQVWALYHLQIMGEAAAKVSAETKANAPCVPWRELNALRNIIVHRYFGIDAREIWNTVCNDVLPLQESFTAVLKGIEGSSP